MTKIQACLLMAAMWVIPAAWAEGTDNAVILLYHHISDSTPASTSVTPETFEQHLQYLADGYNVISLEQAIDQLKSAKPLPKHAVVISNAQAPGNFSLCQPALN